MRIVERGLTLPLWVASANIRKDFPPCFCGQSVCYESLGAHIDVRTDFRTDLMMAFARNASQPKGAR